MDKHQVTSTDVNSKKADEPVAAKGSVSVKRFTDPSTLDGSPAPPSTPPTTGGWSGGHKK